MLTYADWLLRILLHIPTYVTTHTLAEILRHLSSGAYVAALLQLLQAVLHYYKQRDS
jgi:hypothetical protein